jgi:DNA repair protein RecO (recombination protein O)
MARARLVTPAVVVGTVEYGEADRVVTLLTRDAGKRAALARGARKSQRRFGAGLSLFGTGEATLCERPGANLDVLEAFHVARGFPHLMTDVAKVAHGGYACELVRELSPPRQPEPEVFDLLLSLLGLLDGAPARAEALRVFELALLERVGLRPVVDRCVGCGAGEDALDGAGQTFDARRGGVACGACRRPEGRPLQAEARRALARAQQASLDEAAGLAFAPSVNAACREALGALIVGHLGRPLKSLEFIHKLNAAVL